MVEDLENFRGGFASWCTLDGYIVIYCRVDPPFSPVAPGVHLEIVPDAAARLTQ